MQKKVCSKCGQMRFIDQFDRRKQGANDGRTSRCKECRKAEVARWRAENPEKALESRAATYYRHHQKNLDRARRNYDKDANREWKQANRDRINEQARLRYQEDPERFRRYAREDFERNRERRLRKQKDSRDLLSDHYVRRLLAPDSLDARRMILQSLIEAKRVQLQIKRLIKEKTK